jgi:hypothetical protein
LENLQVRRPKKIQILPKSKRRRGRRFEREEKEEKDGKEEQQRRKGGEGRGGERDHQTSKHIETKNRERTEREQ